MPKQPSKKPVVSKREIRIQTAPQKFEIRKNSDGTRTISGYAVRFNSLSLDLGGFKEKIAPGSFTQSLKDHPDVQILYAHNDALILGRVSSGTAKVEQDDNGVRFSCTLPDTSTARDLIALMERGDLSQMSFGFSAISDVWQDVGGQIIRTVTEAILYECSVVGSPAYESTSVSVRSCPTELRSRLKKRSDTDDDDDGICDPDSDNYDPDACDDEDDNDEECSCRCAECRDGRCEECSNADCDDDNCLACAQQERAVHMDLIMRRFRA